MRRRRTSTTGSFKAGLRVEFHPKSGPTPPKPGVSLRTPGRTDGVQPPVPPNTIATVPLTRYHPSSHGRSCLRFPPSTGESGKNLPPSATFRTSLVSLVVEGHKNAPRSGVPATRPAGAPAGVVPAPAAGTSHAGNATTGRFPASWRGLAGLPRSADPHRLRATRARSVTDPIRDVSPCRKRSARP